MIKQTMATYISCFSDSINSGFRDAIFREHNYQGVTASFEIRDEGNNIYNIEIMLENNSWDSMEKSIDAMIQIRKEFIGIISFNYFYF